MNITLDKNISAVDFNGTDIDIVEFNGVEVWRKDSPPAIINIGVLETYTIGQLKNWTINEMEGN